MSKLKKHKIFQATDHLVSGEAFSIYWDSTKNRAWTGVEHLNSQRDYYESSEYIPHSSKADSLFSSFYMWGRRIMLIYKYAILKRHLLPNSRLLDIGCGTGSFLSFMKKKQFDVLGVESNIKARKICFKRGIVVESSESKLGLACVDAIFLWHVLEHLPNPENSLLTYRSILKPEGLLVVAAPNFESHDKIHYQQNWAALDVPRHLWHFTPKGLIKMAYESGFDLLKKRALVLDVFYICYLSEKHRKKSFPFVRGIFKGTFFSIKAFFTGRHSSLVYVFRKRPS